MTLQHTCKINTSGEVSDGQALVRLNRYGPLQSQWGKTRELTRRLETFKERKIENKKYLIPERNKGRTSAKRMRLVMKRDQDIFGCNVKTLEKAGQKLRNTPWKGQVCGRNKCVTGSQDEEQRIDSRKSIFLYFVYRSL